MISLKQQICIIFVVVIIITGRVKVEGNQRRCLVLADGYVSEYSWGKYQEISYPAYHPGHTFLLRGIMNYPGRFNRWLKGWEVKRIDIEKHSGPLILNKVDLIIIDDVRQYVMDPYEQAIVEFVRKGGSLLVYAGFFGLGGCSKNEYNINNNMNSPKSHLVDILPIEIIKTPDLEMKNEGIPIFVDKVLGDGIDTLNWRIYGIHVVNSKGDVLARVDDNPLICSGRFGRGKVVVYTGDDLTWIRVGNKSKVINHFSGTLWRRLVSMSIGENVKEITAEPDSIPLFEKTASFAHSDQPINFLWGGGQFSFSGIPEIEKFWIMDLVTHSSNFYMDGNFDTSHILGNAGITGSFAGGQYVSYYFQSGGSIKRCINNPIDLRTMEETISKRALEVTKFPWIKYGHMGDEPEYRECYCEYCQSKFREKFGYELPKLQNDFSSEYLDKWIDYCLFKNKSVGEMYKRAANAFRQNNPNLKYMFASIPQTGGMAFGDDQLNTQSGFDLLWDHTYPGTQPIRVGLNSSILEETAVLQKRPYVPIYNLLQAFDSMDRVPYVPPAEYIRTMAWEAISHGTDSVGWFVYNIYLWNLSGTEAWKEIGRLGKEVLEPLTPTLYEMLNSQQPIGLLYSYSQEAVDGLKTLAPKEKENPWNSIMRWWSLHALHEAYEVMKYAHLPFNIVSEHRLFNGEKLPWKVIIIPYVEHLHSKSLQVLKDYTAGGGIVYVGTNSTLDFPWIKKLPMSFDTFFTTWFPKNRQEEWNQRRSRVYTISTSLIKAAQLRDIFQSFLKETMVAIDDPEIIYNIREAGEAKYIFLINDHQINPVSPELRKIRQKYNHFSLMPMEFSRVKAKIYIKGDGYLYPLLFGSYTPLVLKGNKQITLNLNFDGGDGKIFLLLPEKIHRIKFIDRPVLRLGGINIKVCIISSKGIINASLPLQVNIKCRKIQQIVYNTTKNGILEWEVPFLKDFPKGPLDITITDLASGEMVRTKLQ